MRALTLTFALALAPLAACGDDAPTFDDARPADAQPVIDAAPSDADEPGPDASCFTNPQTHFEIINGCTTAEKIYKTPDLPLLLPDGGLPPLP
jgi:hypothetical protein